MKPNYNSPRCSFYLISALFAIIVFYYHWSQIPVVGKAVGQTSLPAVLLIGDSITQTCWSVGWAAMLADQLVRRCDVLGRGFSGYTTRNIRAINEEILGSFNSPLVGITVMLGSNDAVDPAKDAQRHVPLDEYEQNLVNITTTFLQAHSYLAKSNFMIISAPPVDDKRAATLARNNKDLAQYAAVTRRVAQSLGVSHGDFFEKALKYPKTDKFWSDGLHLGPEGSQFFFKNILWPAINLWTQNLPPLSLSNDESF